MRALYHFPPSSVLLMSYLMLFIHLLLFWSSFCPVSLTSIFIVLFTLFPSSICRMCSYQHSLAFLSRYPVSILGFENCQSFFSATAHVRCTAPARPTPRGRCHSAYSIFYWLAKRHCDHHISLQHASNCIKNTILSLVYIKQVVYYNKRSWKRRGIADLKRNP